MDDVLTHLPWEKSPGNVPPVSPCGVPADLFLVLVREYQDMPLFSLVYAKDSVEAAHIVRGKMPHMAVRSPEFGRIVLGVSESAGDVFHCVTGDGVFI